MEKQRLKDLICALNDQKCWNVFSLAVYLGTGVLIRLQVTKKMSSSTECRSERMSSAVSLSSCPVLCHQSTEWKMMRRTKRKVGISPCKNFVSVIALFLTQRPELEIIVIVNILMIMKFFVEDPPTWTFMYVAAFESSRIIHSLMSCYLSAC